MILFDDGLSFVLQDDLLWRVEGSNPGLVEGMALAMLEGLDPPHPQCPQLTLLGVAKALKGKAAVMEQPASPPHPQGLVGVD